MVNSNSAASLVEFSFVSKAMQDLPAAVALRILRQSWQFNLRMGLTGQMQYEDGVFRQTVEGPCDAVLPLSARILTDKRHGAITITSFRPIDSRSHASWSAEGFETFEPDAPAELTGDNVARLPEAKVAAAGAGQSAVRRL